MSTCANPSCSNTFEPRRPHHRYCSGTCRKAGWVRQQESAAQTPGERVPDVSAHRVRRPSRDGSGSRLYITPIEIALLRVETVPVSLKPKLARAAERIAA